MTTKTIPEYLQDELQKHDDDALRIESEAARIKALQHGHHRNTKSPSPESASPVEVSAKTRKASITSITSNEKSRAIRTRTKHPKA
jgi:hypothetical protein